ncbi:MAG TPA: hypothetical protein VIO58_12585 [Candidatus Methanoperedens sp.]
MGISDVPTSFGLSFFIRTFFPTSIAIILYGIAFYPFIKTTFWFALAFENKILVWILLSLLIGILLNLLDIYIYQFYEGLRFWPKQLKDYFLNKQEVKFKKIDNELKNIYDIIDEKEKLLKTSDDDSVKNKLDVELRELHEKAVGLWAEIRKYPFKKEYDSYSRRYAEYPTEFGNVLAEYEQYSERQYGMHMMVFWQHIWFILPKDIKDDLELRSAKADFSVYISFLLLTYIFIGTIGFAFWSNILGIISFFSSTVFCYISYKMAIQEHKTYGRYIKAIFDLYRFDLADKLDIVMSKNPIEENKSWTKLRHHLLDYEPL